MKIIQENEYLDTMKNEVEPYLKAHCRDGYIPGAEDIYHEKNGIIGKIHVKRYLADDPKGHGPVVQMRSRGRSAGSLATVYHNPGRKANGSKVA